MDHIQTVAKAKIGGVITTLNSHKMTERLDFIPQAILKRYEKWKDIVRISGPTGLRLIKGFHDERLHGEWKGHRSSRLGDQYRVLYQIEEHIIFAIDVTAHDYGRKS